MTEAAGTTAASPVNERVATLVNDLIRTAAGADAEHLSERLRTEAGRWRAKETTVVVAGEPNRGKSSLINALLGEQAVPTGAMTATGAHVVLRHGPERAALVVRDGAEPEPVAWEQAADLVVGAAPGEVDGVVLELDHPLLETGLVLVDTPGVGGLGAAHARITLTALSNADALVFLLDPAEPLSRPELTFLAGAADRLDRVVFVIVRTDRNPAWRIVADDDRRLLSEHAPRFAGAPLTATSAKLAIAARGSGGTVDEALLAESGLRDLSDLLLRSIVGQVAAVRLANLLRLAATAVDALEAPSRSIAEASDGVPEAQQVAARAQAAHDELRDTAERVQVDVTDRFNAIRELANAEFARLMRELAAGVDSHKQEVPDPDALVANLQAEVRAGCAELTERLDGEVRSIVEDITDALGDLDLDLQSLDVDSDLLSTAGGVDQADVDPMGRVRAVSSVASGGTSMGMSIFYASQGNVVLSALIGTGAVVAVTMAAVNAKLSRRQRDIATLRKQVQGALEGARTEVSTALRQRLLVVQRDVERAMKASVRRQARELQAQVTEATQLARADAAERQTARVEATRRLQALAPLRQRVDALQAEVSGLLSS